MGFVGDMFSSNKGMGYTASGTPIAQPVTSDQASQALAQQQATAQQAAAQNGFGNQTNVFGQAQALAGQLGEQTQGGGPNPALAQLNQTTGQNVANQAALMAGQRGSSANVGMMARQAAQQGANTQQQAVGQAATMRAQQMIAAQQQLQQQQGLMAGIAGQQVNNQIGTGQQYAGNTLGQINAQNQANVGMQSNINNANAGIQGQTAQAQGNVFKGVTNAAGSAIGMADGGAIQPPDVLHFGKIGNDLGLVKGQDEIDAGYPNSADPIPHPVDSSEGNDDGPQSQLGQYLKSALTSAVTNMATGGSVYAKGGMNKVPGKAAVAGDSAKNDTVQAMLSPGEGVIPRTAMTTPEKAAAFARQMVMKNKRK